MLSQTQMTTPVIARNETAPGDPCPLLMLTGYLRLIYDGENWDCLF